MEGLNKLVCIKSIGKLRIVKIFYKGSNLKMALT